jgi:hypothetical protein
VLLLGVLPALVLQCAHMASAAGPYNKNLASAEESSQFEGRIIRRTMELVTDQFMFI